MRLLLSVGLVVSLVGTGGAASSAPVPYTLTFNTPEQVIGMDGVIRILRVTGVMGGVAVIGEYTENAWRVGPTVAPEHTLADGRLACTRGRCTFSISTLLDQPAGIQGPSFAIGRSISGLLPGFATRREWVSAVSRWAKDNVDPGPREKIVSQAAGGQAGDGQ